MALHVEQFNWNRTTKTLSEEISTLQIELKETLLIEGHNATLAFEHVHTDRDADQDVRYWEYLNRRNNIRLIIWND